MLPWTTPAWLSEARAWIEAKLARLGLELSEPVQQPHVRPWSTVLRAPTSSGPVWLKANMPVLAHEAAVLQVLARRRPDAVPRLLAVDLERGWMLQADGGVRLRELLAGDPDPARWEKLLHLYAGLQIDAAANLGELLRAGAPDRRLAVLPAQYEELLERVDSLAGDERDRLRALAPRVAGLAEELEALGLPETIQHDDLHTGNAFVRNGGYVVFDWGDACVSHPFFTLHVTLRVLAWERGVEEGAAELDRFRDAYLEPWTRFRPHAELLAALGPADLLAGICRALTWYRILSALPAATAAEYEDAVVDRLRFLRTALD
jgi:hypothetical protein